MVIGNVGGGTGISTVELINTCFLLINFCLYKFMGVCVLSLRKVSLYPNILVLVFFFNLFQVYLLP